MCTTRIIIVTVCVFVIALSINVSKNEGFKDTDVFDLYNYMGKIYIWMVQFMEWIASVVPIVSKILMAIFIIIIIFWGINSLFSKSTNSSSSL